MVFSNLSPEVARRCRIQMIIGGLVILILGIVFLFLDIFEDAKMVGYLLVGLGPIEMLIGYIIFKPKDGL
jgi:hypothetical protein